MITPSEEKKIDRDVIENMDRWWLPSNQARTQQVCSQLILLIACVDRCRAIDPRVFSLTSASIDLLL